jgi:hypothetical protein
MNWLDDMEAADPAYPDTGPTEGQLQDWNEHNAHADAIEPEVEPASPDADAGPWADPAYVPDASRGLPAEVGNAVGEQARRQNTGATEPGPEGPFSDGLPGDPWAQPPDTASQAPVGAGAAQMRPTERTVTIDEACQVADDAVGLFLEHRDMHGRSEADARIEALGEVADRLHAWRITEQAVNPHPAVGRDWRALRAAEAQAREAGLGASIPQPDSQDSPEYQADAAGWGSGRGIGPDGPEVG